MTNDFIYTFLLIFVPIFISRFMLEKALKKLDAETKVKLLDGFSNQRKYAGIVMIPIMVIYFLLLKLMPEYIMTTVSVFGGMFVVYFIAVRILNYKKLLTMNAPEDYLKTYKLATFVVALGFLCVGVQLFMMFISQQTE